MLKYQTPFENVNILPITQYMAYFMFLGKQRLLLIKPSFQSDQFGISQEAQRRISIRIPASTVERHPQLLLPPTDE